MWRLQAQQLCAVLEEHGEKHLEAWQVPLLTWEELQELKQLYEAAPMPTLESPGSGEHLLLRELDQQGSQVVSTLISSNVSDVMTVFLLKVAL